jgi:hypothetical protein
MTPVIFVSFLVSLAWVDFRYSIRRSHNHAEKPGRLPDWLHHIIYRATPYQNVKMAGPPRSRAQGGSTTDGTTDDDDKPFYYHSKQRKLMKMEVDDAFQIRRSVVVVLMLLAMGATWGLWRMGSCVWRMLIRT